MTTDSAVDLGSSTAPVGDGDVGSHGRVDTTTGWQLAQRTRIQAFRAGRYVLLLAEGRVPDPGFEVDVQRSPLRIFPQQYNLVQRRRPGFFPAVFVTYRYAEVVLFPAEAPTVVVHHADGSDSVDVEEAGEDLAGFTAVVSDGPSGAHSAAAEAVGSSAGMSFDEAFADAVANLPPFEPPFPDATDRVVVADTGALFGGIAGLHHLFVRVRRVTA
jgi:hypothetical protein